ncbi:S-adenosylmethionine-dependent methyltransferase [candidate division KSB1 bacterium]|nr:MAG: S-adenosylmethionine-dependent methyltransferase [candidate division KSB1 bacterium]
MDKQTFSIEPIGFIQAQNGDFSIQIQEKYRPALLGLDEYSHVQVTWWANLMDSREFRSLLVAEKPYTKGPDKIGIFATRSPARPNPLAITSTAIIRIDQKSGTIFVPYIDAEDGTPVIDLKPYHPSTERIREVRVPQWNDHWPKWLEDSGEFDWEAEFNF